MLRFKMKSLAGDEVDLFKYQGQVVMIVNVASKCGYTGQYEQLQKLHEKYASQGLAILGFPCNQFLGQEPGSAEEIAAFCRTNYGVTFDMFAKVEVNGENACDLYKLLTSLDTKPKGPGKIGWNFEKFLVGRNGIVVARFGSSTKPDALDVVQIIETELARGVESGASPSAHTQLPGQELKLADFLWKNRILLLFAPTPNEDDCVSFRRAWEGLRAEVNDRNLLLLEAYEEGESCIGMKRLARASAAQLREEFEIAAGSTVFVLIGKDGAEKLRKATLEMDDLFQTVDAMPMRKREMEEDHRQ